MSVNATNLSKHIVLLLQLGVCLLASLHLTLQLKSKVAHTFKPRTKLWSDRETGMLLSHIFNEPFSTYMYTHTISYHHIWHIQFLLPFLFHYTHILTNNTITTCDLSGLRGPISPSKEIPVGLLLNILSKYMP